MMHDPDEVESMHGSRLHRRRRMRRHGRRAYIRSVYFLPSLATLGNAVCGFGAIYVAGLVDVHGRDPLTARLASNHLVYACYLIFLAMIFDALDGRLARFTRHTTDFGGQLDSLADVISFGAAPAFIALQVFKSGMLQQNWDPPLFVTRLIWAIGALFMSCAALRLAKFNVSNQHGEQHHFSFLGLPSPGAAGAVAAFILMQQDLLTKAAWLESGLLLTAARVCVWILPIVVLLTGLLMISNLRYPHLVNRYLRGRRSIGRLLFVLVLALLLWVWFQYTLAAGMLIYAMSAPISWSCLRLRRRGLTPGLSDPPHST